jgi:hypothetical protein
MEIHEEFIKIMNKEVAGTIDIVNDLVRLYEPKLDYLEAKLKRHHKEQEDLMKAKIKAKTIDRKQRVSKLLEVVELATIFTDGERVFTKQLLTSSKKRLAELLYIQKKLTNKPQTH